MIISNDYHAGVRYDWHYTKTMTKRRALVFLASFPPIQGAIKRGQDGMRIQLDIPESEMGNAVELIGMMNAVLKITVEAAPINTNASSPVKGDFEIE